MSNSVRSLGSGRNVDAVARHGSEHQTDIGGGTDAEFAAVMNLVIGATEGAIAGNGEGTDPEGSVAGHGHHRNGQGGTSVGQIGDAPNDDANAMPVSGLDRSDLGSTSTLDGVVVSPVGVEPSRQGDALLLADTASKSPWHSQSSQMAETDPSMAASPAFVPIDLTDTPNGLAVAGQSPPQVQPDGIGPQPAARSSDTINSADAAVAIGNDPTPSSIGVLFGANGGTIDVASSPAQRRHHVVHSLASGSAPTSGSSNSDATTSSDDVAAPALSLGITLVVTAADAASSAGTPKADASRQSRATDNAAPPSPVPSLSTARGGWMLPTNGASLPGWRVRLDSNSGPTTNPAMNQTDPTVTSATSLNSAFNPRQLTGSREYNGASMTSDRIAVRQNAADQSQGDANTASADTSTILPSTPDNHSNAAPGPPALAPTKIPMPATTILNAVTSGGAPDARPIVPTVVTTIGSVAGTAPLNATNLTSTTADAGAGAPTGVPSSFGDAMVNHVLSMISTGHQEATLQLQPPQLGELTVRVAVQGRDVSTWFGAAQPQVQVAVSQALDQLRADLAGAGLNLAGAWVGADASGMRHETLVNAAPSRRPNFAPSIDSSTVDDNDVGVHSSGVSVYV